MKKNSLIPQLTDCPLGLAEHSWHSQSFPKDFAKSLFQFVHQSGTELKKCNFFNCRCLLFVNVLSISQSSWSATEFYQNVSRVKVSLEVIVILIPTCIRTWFAPYSVPVIDKSPNKQDYFSLVSVWECAVTLRLLGVNTVFSFYFI